MGGIPHLRRSPFSFHHLVDCTLAFWPEPCRPAPEHVGHVALQPSPPPTSSSVLPLNILVLSFIFLYLPLLRFGDILPSCKVYLSIKTTSPHHPLAVLLLGRNSHRVSSLLQTKIRLLLKMNYTGSSLVNFLRMPMVQTQMLCSASRCKPQS